MFPFTNDSSLKDVDQMNIDGTLFINNLIGLDIKMQIWIFCDVGVLLIVLVKLYTVEICMSIAMNLYRCIKFL